MADEEQSAQPEHSRGTTVPDLLEIRNLSFTHEAGTGEGMPEKTTQALTNISFTIPHGSKTGIFGPVGSGKTTLFNLITRLYDPPPETIFYKGKDVLCWEISELRREIGYALQGAFLFSDTIRENLLFGLPESVDDAMLNAALEAACIDCDIANFPEGLNTPIGEKGVRLSGGQKQRLALARLFLHNPKFIILDDVFSAVDQTTERKLAANLPAQSEGLLVASHRITVLSRCDTIIILENGRVSDRGSFSALSNKNKLPGDDLHADS